MTDLQQREQHSNSRHCLPGKFSCVLIFTSCQHRFKTLNFSFKAGPEVTTIGSALRHAWRQSPSNADRHERPTAEALSQARGRKKNKLAQIKNAIGSQSLSGAFLFEMNHKQHYLKPVCFLMSSFLLLGFIVNAIQVETGTNLYSSHFFLGLVGSKKVHRHNGQNKSLQLLW